MTKFLDSKKLTCINFLIVGYFIFQFSVYYLSIKHVAIGFIIELFTIPFLIAQVVFILIGIRHFIKNSNQIVFLASFIVLIISFLYIVSTF